MNLSDFNAREPSFRESYGAQTMYENGLNASNHIKMWSELQFDAWLTENTQQSLGEQL